MAKRLLRGVIDFGDNRITPENLGLNFRRLVRSGFDWHNPDERKLFEYVKAYVQENHEAPSESLARDYFERTNDLTVTEKLLDIKAVEVYVRTHYDSLLKQLLEDQNQNKVRKLLQEVEEIVTRGKVIDKKPRKGVKEGLLYFNEKVYEAIPSDSNAKTEGEILSDTKAVWDAYQEAKHNKGKVYGRFTGIEAVDTVCHGIKPGELWVHAAYPGQLKCLAGDTYVYDHRTHRRRRLKEMYDCGEVPTVTALVNEGRESTLEITPSSHLKQNGVREVFDLVLESGRSIGATSNHKFFTPNGWVDLSGLKEGDFIATPRKMDAEGLTAYTSVEVRLVGYLIGDGHLIDNISFSQINEVIRNDFIECLKELGLIEGAADYEKPNYTVNFPEGKVPNVRVAHGLGDRWHRVRSPVRHLLERVDLYGKGSYEKRVPSEFFGLTEELLAQFIGAIWSTDGSCSTNDYLRKNRIAEGKIGGLQSNYTISYASVSKGLCQDIQSLLLRLGIQATVTKTEGTYENEPYYFWTLRVVTNPSKTLFCSKIKVIGKEASFDHLASRIPDRDSTHIPSSLVPDGVRVLFNGYWAYSRTARLNKTISIERAARYGFDPGDIYWDVVSSVSSRGFEMTYDLEVPKHHTFVANDIITHNTTFAMNWGYNLATRYRANTLYISLEMKYEQLRGIACAMHTANGMFRAQGLKPLDYRKIRDGELDSEEDELFYKTALDDLSSNKEYHNFQIWAPDREVTVADIRVHAELVQKNMDIGLIIVDHGGLVKADKSYKDFTIEQNSVIRALKMMALQFNGGVGVPILMLFQINRQGFEMVEKKKGTPEEGLYTFSALSYSNEAEKSADYVTTTYLNDPLRQQGATILANLKNRDNPLFPLTKVRIDFGCRRMRNWELTDQVDIGHEELSQENAELLSQLV